MAATTRTSTGIGLVPPTRWTFCSSITRSTLACASSDMSPISSRKSVPPSACSNLPLRCSVAPVNEPFSWPKSSLSSSSRGIAAQLTSTKGPCARGLRSWRRRATSSLPVPFSPWIRTRALVGATFSTSARISARAALLPTMRVVASDSRPRRAVFSLASLRSWAALRTASSTRSRSSGFSMKSKAPRRVASTAVSMVPWPEIMTTSVSGRRSMISERISSPSRPGILMSRNVRSMSGSAASAARPLSPSSARVTSWCSNRRTRSRLSRMATSSSTIRIFTGPPMDGTGCRFPSWGDTTCRGRHAGNSAATRGSVRLQR